MSQDVIGRIHSIQSLGTVDGPGVRFVAFLQGCPLRCGCCHNPDTWDRQGGTEYTPRQLVDKALRFREYFGKAGGITLSGGEPLLQADFCREVFRICHEEGIHTCLDTSGCILDGSVKSLLEETDRVLLDVKYTTEKDYRRYVGCSMEPVLSFLAHLNEQGIPTTVRQVTIPTLNDTPEQIGALRAIIDAHPCVDHAELLPFRKICQVKYDSLHLSFPFGNLPEADVLLVKELEKLLYA